MILDTKQMLALLPAIYRLRDLERGSPLAGVLEVIAEQIQVLQEDLAQLYDDQFIETCADWVVPYIGDLVGYRQLYGVTAAIRSPRSEVANTIGLRRRKGTVAVLESLARDVTGWDALVVEFFQLLATTQYLNHVRPNRLASPDLRDGESLEALGTAFDTTARTADLRQIGCGGRYNIPNVGIFLWRLRSYPLDAVPAFKVDSQRFLFNPLGINTPLANRPVTLPPDASLATALNLPLPISRRLLDSRKSDYYGPDRAIFIEGVDATKVVACNLADLSAGGAQWAHTPPAGTVAIDPVLGRIAFAEAPAQPPRARFNYLFAADLGGGEYDRLATIDASLGPVATVPQPNATVQAALNAVVAGGGAVEIADNGRYAETLAINLGAGVRLELRAADLRRASVLLSGEFKISGDGSVMEINGLVIAGGAVHVTATSDQKSLSTLRISHCTLVPGISLAADGTAVQPGSPSLIVDTPGTAVQIDHCIVGALAVADGASVNITNSIVDSGSGTSVAYAATNGFSAGAPLSVSNSTVIGRIHTANLHLATNSILFAQPSSTDPHPWDAAVWSERRQDGCVRFSYLPFDSRVPRRYQCQPANASDGTRVRPVFNSLRFGDAAYCQLARRCAPEILRGADDGAQMGVYHDLFSLQRETNLSVRLAEYLRVELNGGLLFAS